ncbi:MAG TPA: MmgE/PrpD family protein [Xanthobacteraceae bacterium]|nr:MmgE/PrpD family protein [Xanthobacteraceae bacterium]
MNETDFVGARLGAFVVETDGAALPTHVLHEGKRALVNFFGCAIGAGRAAACDTLVQVLRTFGAGDKSTLLGRPDRLDPPDAAFVNAVSANLLDYDDTHLPTVIHPTAPVAAPLLAVAETRGLTGRAVLEAFVLGAEIECRIGNAVSPGHYARGWHITTTCGVFGAAAAMSRLLGLSPAQTWHALGIAASQSAGVVENLATAAKNASLGSAARNGILAALLAAAGYEAAPAAIEGRLGWAQASGGDDGWREGTAALGTRWELLANTYKPYPCGIVLHAVIDACLALRQQHGIVADQVAAVTVRGNALLLARGDRVVNNERDARISIQHSVAVALLRGRAGIAEFSEEAARDVQIAQFRQKVSAVLAAEMPVGAAAVVIDLADGRHLTHTVLAARGSRESPLMDGDLTEKTTALMREAGVGASAAPLLERLWALERETDLRGLMRLTRANDERK